MQHWLRDKHGFLVFLLCFGFFRTAIADWNPIPSESMRATLQQDGVVLVNRLAYDLKLPLGDIVLARLGDPRRGDVVTFSSPGNGQRLIKRIVALPGDRVEMRLDRLFINGRAAQYREPSAALETLAPGLTVPALRLSESLAGERPRRVQWLDGVAARRDLAPQHVPEGCYFVLGDNRDNSADSRFIGCVPRRLLIGRAHHILVSADIRGRWLPRRRPSLQAMSQGVSALGPGLGAA